MTDKLFRVGSEIGRGEEKARLIHVGRFYPNALRVQGVPAEQAGRLLTLGVAVRRMPRSLAPG